MWIFHKSTVIIVRGDFFNFLTLKGIKMNNLEQGSEEWLIEQYKDIFNFSILFPAFSEKLHLNMQESKYMTTYSDDQKSKILTQASFHSIFGGKKHALLTLQKSIGERLGIREACL